MEDRTNNFRAIETQIHYARLEQSRFIGELIARAIFAIWMTARHLATFIVAKVNALVKTLVKTPDEYSTAKPRHF